MQQHHPPQSPQTGTDTRCSLVARDFVFNSACEYIDHGWSVLPLHGKRPALTSWREYQSARASVNQLREWFVDASLNVGVVTGRISELVVVDCDRIEDATFWREQFPKTPLAVRTGRGGSHFYYRYPLSHDISNRAGLLDRRIDLRAEGGYVVAPPSRHPLGDHYEWEVGEGSLNDIPEFSPDWIAAESPAMTSSNRGMVQHPRSYIRSIHAVSGQHGHNHTFRAACTLRDAGLTPEEALCELIEWNTTNASPPWTVRELLHKVQSAYRLQSFRGQAFKSIEPAVAPCR